MQLLPYSYGCIKSSLTCYIPNIIAILLLGIIPLITYILKRKNITDKFIRVVLIVGSFIIICAINILILYIPYKYMSPFNEDNKYVIEESIDVVDYDIKNQTVTYIKNDTEITKPTLISFTTDKPVIEIRKYSKFGMSRTYRVTLVNTPDHVEE